MIWLWIAGSSWNYLNDNQRSGQAHWRCNHQYAFGVAYLVEFQNGCQGVRGSFFGMFSGEITSPSRSYEGGDGFSLCHILEHFQWTWTCHDCICTVFKLFDYNLAMFNLWTTEQYRRFFSSYLSSTSIVCSVFYLKWMSQSEHRHILCKCCSERQPDTTPKISRIRAVEWLKCVV